MGDSIMSANRLNFYTKILIWKFLGALMATSAIADQATDYTPPSSPPLYTPVDPTANVQKLNAHPFIGLGIAIGQSQPTGKENPLTAALGSIQLGYLKTIGSWNLVLGELLLFSGQAGHSDADLQIPIGAMVRLGYGYMITSGIYGIFKIGGGAFNGHYRSEKFGIAKEASALGNAAHLAYHFGFAMNEDLFFESGLSLTHVNASFSELENQSTKTMEPGTNIAVNLLQLELGLKYLF